MAQFNPTMSQAPSAFNPIVDPVDNSVPDGINAATSLLGQFGKVKADSDKAAAEQASAEGLGNLFSETLRTEAEVITSQDKLVQNQKQYERLYADGIISEEERSELNQLQKDRTRLEGLTNRRQRQVQLRMKYANFVNRYPHLTKEARTLFGDAETRLGKVAEGNEGLVDKEAFESIYGKEGYTAQNVTTFRGLQRFQAERKVGTVYGEANFQDWNRSFQADVTTEMYTIGQRTLQLLNSQGSLRTEDIDVFNSNLREGYMTAVKQIDQTVLDLQKQGQYVDKEQITAAKQELESVRNDMMKYTDGADFTTRLQKLNTAMELHLENRMNIELGPVAKLFSTGGAGKGSADLATLQQILSDGANIKAAKLLPGIYGDQVRTLQEGAAKYINFLDTYDAQEASRYIAPALTRQLAGIQGTRIDNGLLNENPEALKTFIDLSEQGGTSDEVVEGLLSRPKIVNDAATRNNEAKGRLSSLVNNYALETEQFLQDINGRVQQTEQGPVVVTSVGGGKLVRNAEGTAKLNNLQNLYKEMPIVGDMTTYNSILDKQVQSRNEVINQAIQELQQAVQGPQGVNTQLLSSNLRQMKLQFGLTDQEVAEISSLIRSDNAESGN